MTPAEISLLRPRPAHIAPLLRSSGNDLLSIPFTETGTGFIPARISLTEVTAVPQGPTLHPRITELDSLRASRGVARPVSASSDART